MSREVCEHGQLIPDNGVFDCWECSKKYASGKNPRRASYAQLQARILVLEGALRKIGDKKNWQYWDEKGYVWEGEDHPEEIAKEALASNPSEAGEVLFELIKWLKRYRTTDTLGIGERVSVDEALTNAKRTFNL